MKDIMVDIESFGTGTLPVIASIGAVRFNLDTGETGDEFYVNIDINSQIKNGFAVDGETIRWWMEQSEEAQKALFHPEPLLIPSALDMFANFVKEEKDSTVWGNGSNFDNRIIREAYYKLSLTCPWHFRHDRDVRTLVALGRRIGVNPKNKQEFEGTAHNALDDCKHQIKYCCDIWNAIKES